MNRGANEYKKFTGTLKQNENEIPVRRKNKAVVS
jgi:hypothetical protein